LIGEKFGIRKIGPDAHLYISDNTVPELEGLGKWFEIQEVAPFGKAAMRDFATRWPGAGVTARALPLSSDGLRKKMGVNGGGGVHIFGVGTIPGRLLIAASRWIQGLR
jgi:hypothetical protein